jgi:outer membrane protein OmpA-like peptidoglycan-associated protein
MISNRWLYGLTICALLLSGCASAPQSPAGSDLVREKLTRLQTDPVLANKAPDALEVAERAVRLAEQPLTRSDDDQALGAHRVYLADLQVEIAMAKAATRHSEDEREQLAQQRARVRLDARTREADRARTEVDRARVEADRMASEGAAARAASAAEAAELQRQIAALQAEITDRGLVLTLGNVLFGFDSANLQAGATGSLDRLVTFLKEYPTRNASIEGHTDSVGNADYNQRLSQRRAESVRSYLVQQGIGRERLTASGLGQTQPVASNDSDSGRQLNRRVEIVIDNPPLASTSTHMR